MNEPATVEAQLEEPEAQAPSEIRPIQPIPVNRLGLQVEHNNAFRVNVPQGTRPEQVMDESVWAHIGIRLKPGDQIHVMPDDMAWELVLGVYGAGRSYAHVVKKVLYDLVPTEVGEKLPSIYKIEYKGTTYKWRVERDGRVLREGFESEGLARRYAANHQDAADR